MEIYILLNYIVLYIAHYREGELKLYEFKMESIKFKIANATDI